MVTKFQIIASIDYTNSGELSANKNTLTYRRENLPYFMSWHILH